jgi:hypothetical protein
MRKVAQVSSSEAYGSARISHADVRVASIRRAMLAETSTPVHGWPALRAASCSPLRPLIANRALKMPCPMIDVRIAINGSLLPEKRVIHGTDPGFDRVAESCDTASMTLEL